MFASTNATAIVWSVAIALNVYVIGSSPVAFAGVTFGSVAISIVLLSTTTSAIFQPELGVIV